MASSSIYEIDQRSQTEDKGTLQLVKRPPWDKDNSNEEEGIIGMRHRYHKHRLIFRSTSVVSSLPNSNLLGCNGCYRLIEGPHYSCVRCKYFLHEFCAILPVTIHDHPHVCERNHYLEMLASPPDQYSAQCRVCHQGCSKGFTYHCLYCSRFDIHLLCAWLPNSVSIKGDHKDHKHEYNLLSKPSNFSCDSCNVELGTKTSSFMCFTCKHWVHMECVVSPRSIRHDDHPLRFVDFFDDYDKEGYCNFCEKLIEKQNSTDFCFSVCGCISCERFFHVGCLVLATLSSKRADTTVVALVGDSIEDSTDQDDEWFMMGVGPKENMMNEREAEIKHTTHDDHFLKLGTTTDQVPSFERRDVQCNGCKWPLLAPFYSCMKCNFFLHAQCADLPSKYFPSLAVSDRIWFHFKFGSSYSSHGVYLELIEEGHTHKCSNCNASYSGFSYKCRLCKDFNLDLNCAKIRPHMVHEAHQHELYIVEREEPSKQCNACGKSSEQDFTMYFCSICEYYLHVRCALLPRITRHRFDRHPLMLMFKSDVNELGEYICDICEDDQRNPNHWFYGCRECDFAAQVDCICNQ
ncbi:hypothetical protein ACH5RR_002634 [Cinchona calisaya]|uniref:Zinc finger PHD-type domain-containing protein n=1 Tax=Cinchona calisaya TaxID=153742 RepID=A0ABD3ASI5_9GENT